MIETYEFKINGVELLAHYIITPNVYVDFLVLCGEVLTLPIMQYVGKYEKQILYSIIPLTEHVIVEEYIKTFYPHKEVTITYEYKKGKWRIIRKGKTKILINSM